MSGVHRESVLVWVYEETGLYLNPTASPTYCLCTPTLIPTWPASLAHSANATRHTRTSTHSQSFRKKPLCWRWNFITTVSQFHNNTVRMSFQINIANGCAAWNFKCFGFDRLVTIPIFLRLPEIGRVSSTTISGSRYALYYALYRSDLAHVDLLSMLFPFCHELIYNQWYHPKVARGSWNVSNLWEISCHVQISMKIQMSYVELWKVKLERC